MHRVELKVVFEDAENDMEVRVPNAPCGVESAVSLEGHILEKVVPNAPCGVESTDTRGLTNSVGIVPNAPCGVESIL